MIKVLGHRGARVYEPENTLRSFKKAIELGVDQIELDLHFSRDGQLMVIHDDKLNRTTNGEGFIKDFTLDELKKLDAGKGKKFLACKK
jgi:glycerophosphoryl diester phosphodiesterase